MKKNIFLFLAVLLITEPLLGLPQNKDEEFLDRIEKSAFWYFWNETGENGLIQDRMTDKKLSTSMGAGFQLTVLCIGAERGWVSREQAGEKVLQILQTYKNVTPRFRGIMAHYYNIQTGEPVHLMHKEDDGADVSETGFLMAGVIFCRQYFNRSNEVEKKIKQMATELYEDVEWDWMLQDQQGKLHKTLSWHWSPLHGFKIGQRVRGDMELSSLITYILALGSPSHPIPPECWDHGWAKDYKWGHYNGTTFITCPPMFAHQYAHLWIDFRNRHDHHADYFRNSIYATQANREYCLNHLYPGKNLWGLTFCDGPFDYGIYGYPPKAGNVDRDATIAPTAAGASIVFLPEESVSTLKTMYQNYKERLWGKYGFKDSFSLKHDWFDDDYLAIDQGAMLMMIENYRSGLIWKYFMQDPDVRRGMDKAGFVGMIDDFESTQNEKIQPYATWSAVPRKNIKFDWMNRPIREGEKILSAEYRFDKVQEFVLTANPALKNFSPYAYLGFWLKAEGETLSHVSLRDKTGQLSDCTFSSKSANLDWMLYYYALPEQIDLTDIANLSLRFSPLKRNGKIYLDFVHLTNVLPDSTLPAAPSNFQSSPGEYSGEINLTWDRGDTGTDSDTVIRHRLLYSEKSFENEESIPLAQKISPFKIRKSKGASQWSCLISELKPGAKYFFALQSSDGFHRFSTPLTISSTSQPGKTRLVSSGLIDSFTNLELWKKIGQPNSQLEVEQVKGEKKGLTLKYTLPPEHSWVVLQKDVLLSMPSQFRFKLRIRGRGEKKTQLEFKLIDRQGSTFLKSWPAEVWPRQWQTIVVAKEDLDFGWGPTQEMDPIIKSIEFAVSSREGGTGTIEISELSLERKEIYPR